MKKLSLLIVGLLVSSGTYATVKMTNYESIKQKAMGGTTLLSEANETALVNNPALLNEIKKWEINILGIGISTSTETPDIAKGIDAMIKDLDGMKDDSKIINILTAYLDGISWTDSDTGIKYNEDAFKLSNKKLILDINTAIAYVKKNFGVGIFSSVNVNDLRLVNNPVSPELIVDAGATIQVPIGMSFDFGKKNQYLFGTSIKAIGGVNVEGTLDATDLANSDDIPATLQTYKGVALDVGAIWKREKLNYALTINNIYSSLETTEKTGDSEEIDGTDKFPTVINIAISNKYDKKDRQNKWWDKYVFWTLELKNITNVDIDCDGVKDDNLYKKLHFGMNSKILDTKILDLDLRAGINQGYPTYGFGTEWFSFLNLDYSYSTRELGPHVGMKSESLHSITIDFRI